MIWDALTLVLCHWYIVSSQKWFSLWSIRWWLIYANEMTSPYHRRWTVVLFVTQQAIYSTRWGYFHSRKWNQQIKQSTLEYPVAQLQNGMHFDIMTCCHGHLLDIFSTNKHLQIGSFINICFTKISSLALLVVVTGQFWVQPVSKISSNDDIYL